MALWSVVYPLILTAILMGFEAAFLRSGCSSS